MLKERIDNMKVAFSKKDITPKDSCHMAGYNRQEKSIGVLDPIEINTLVWEINQDCFVFCCLDSILLEKEFVDSIRDECHKITRIPFEYIQVCCIHTHSAPAYFKLTFEETIIEPTLRTEMKQSMIETIVTASTKLQECHLTYGTCQIEGVFGNRNTMDGESDKSVNILTFYDNQENIITSFLNMSVHPTILSGKTYLLSSDLLGRVRFLYEKHTHAPAMITNGTCGDTSTRFYRSESEIRKLDDSASSILNQIVDKMQHKAINIQEAKFTLANYTTHSDFRNDSTTINLLNSKDSQAIFLRSRCEQKIAMGEFDLELTASIIKMNDLILITLPGDIVSHFGLKIKDALNEYEVILICYSNMYSNYLVNKEQYGKYFETYNSRCHLGEADRFIDNVIMKAKLLVSS